MAAVDDAATVLEGFCHDVANLPAEIAHLLEEIQAKDQQIMQCRDAITSRDNALQKHVRQMGSHVKHPKEDAFSKTILTNYDRIEILQAEKLGLSEKAMIILDRQIKRFDIKIRDLQAIDQFPLDPTMPSLLQPSAGNTVPPLSGVSTPLNPLSVNTAQGGGAPNIANAAMARLGASNASRSHSPLTTQNPILAQSHLGVSSSRGARESSADTKRRRLNSSLNGSLPTQSSNLRQSSIGPSSTPKANTPGPSTSRAGSAQPSRPTTTKKPPTNKKVAPHHAAAAASAIAVPAGNNRKRARSSILASNKKGDRRRQLAREQHRARGSPSASPTPSDSRGSTSPTPGTLTHGADGTVDSGAASSSHHHRHRNTADPNAPNNSANNDDENAAEESDEEGEEGEEEEGAEIDLGEEDDTQVYCTCQRVSFGDMVACDNEDCRFQWFHWGCVGLKEEPKGEWLCPYCRLLPREKIVKAK